MVRYENQCVGCGSSYRRGCFGCSLTHVPVFFCDECRTEIKEGYDVYGKLLCGDCLEDDFLGTGTPEGRCDKCGAELDPDDWYDDGVELCRDCLQEMYKVELEDMIDA